MDSEFEDLLTRLRGIYRRAGDAERQELLNHLWSLVPKWEDPEPVRGEERMTTCDIRCPCCDEELVIELRC